jgi:Transposase
MRAWCKRGQASGLAEFEGVLGMIDRGMDGITNDFQGRQTRGFVEGFNNRVKVLKRRCYGIFNVGTLFQRLTLDLVGSKYSNASLPQRLWTRHRLLLALISLWRCPILPRKGSHKSGGGETHGLEAVTGLYYGLGGPGTLASQ